MRVFFVPGSDEGWFLLFAVLALIIAGGIGVVVWTRLFPSAKAKALADKRYQEALAVYAEHLQTDDPTTEDRRTAFAEATMYLVDQHGIPSAEASSNLRLMVAEYDRERSYDLRNDALAYEEAGDYASAAIYYERAARMQQEHDPKDCQFLLQCVARVRRKLGSQ